MFEAYRFFYVKKTVFVNLGAREGVGKLKSEKSMESISPSIQRQSYVEADPSVTLSGSGSSDAVILADYSYDLSREVFGILGIPVDAVDIGSVVRTIRSAAAVAKPFLLSTPNLNFLVTSQIDPGFRESLLLSDLCPVDGVPIVWIARLLGAPIKERAAGSDILDHLRANPETSRPSSVFLFGGPPGVAEAAAKVLNLESRGVHCVGHLYPGYGSVEEMSTQNIIDSINSSSADLIVASLGAKKGQEWLMKNHHHLRIPVRSHLGAAINFQAGTLKRAPPWVRKFGLEWLWRIKEEPYLWRRYRDDGRVLLNLMITSVLPLVLNAQWRRLSSFRNQETFTIQTIKRDNSAEIIMKGGATAGAVKQATPYFEDALKGLKSMVLDVSGVTVIDMRFFGLLLMVRKLLLQHGLTLSFVGLTARAQKSFRLNKFEFLLLPQQAHTYRYQAEARAS